MVNARPAFLLKATDGELIGGVEIAMVFTTWVEALIKLMMIANPIVGGLGRDTSYGVTAGRQCKRP